MVLRKAEERLFTSQCHVDSNNDVHQSVSGEELEAVESGIEDKRESRPECQVFRVYSADQVLQRGNIDRK